MMESHTLATAVAASTDLRAAVEALALLLAGILALMVQAGFALFGSGMVRAKNAAHGVAMVLVAYCAGVLGFWAFGFGVQMRLPALFASSALGSSAVAALFVSRAALASVAVGISSGALAERWKLRSLVFFTFLVGALVYPVYARWVWGPGWLAALGIRFGLGHGVVDCAGASVMHMTGGVIGLVAAKMLGPRLGKYSPSGAVRPIPGHNMPMVVLGTFLLAAGLTALAVGWAAAGGPDGAGSAGTMAANLMLASVAGGMAAFVHTRIRFGKPDLSMMCNGLLAGIVATSASGIFVGGLAAVVIGAVGSLLAIEGALFIERRLRIDDPVGAGAVHGLGGAWGLLSVGLFADGRAGDGLNGVAGPVRGLFFGGSGQLVAELVGMVANLVWAALATTVLLWLIGRLVGNRAVAEDEIAGLDVPELGMTGYVNEGVHATLTRSSDLGHLRK